MAVSKRLRYEVLKRDNNTCRYCGGKAPDATLTIDHVVPVTLGGGDEPGNLVAACKDCNAGKSSVPADAPLIAGVAEDALRMAKALELVAEDRAAKRQETEAIYRKFKKEWRSWYSTDWRGEKHYVDLPGDWRRSINLFLDAGLTLDDLLEMVDVALGSRNRGDWKYFCGCCWTLVRENRDKAAAIVAATQKPSNAVEPRLTTSWTTDELDDYVTSSEEYASRYLVQESIESAYCVHREWGMGACGDPVCRMQRAEALTWMADSNHLKVIRLQDRDDAVMDELDRLEAIDA